MYSYLTRPIYLYLTRPMKPFVFQDQCNHSSHETDLTINLTRSIQLFISFYRCKRLSLLTNEPYHQTDKTMKHLKLRFHSEIYVERLTQLRHIIQQSSFSVSHRKPRRQKLSALVPAGYVPLYI